MLLPLEASVQTRWERQSGRGARTRRAASRLVPPSALKAIAARGACSLIRLITASKRAAVIASGDRRKQLARLDVPTLVIHGDQDPLMRPQGGRATAGAIPNAKLVTYPGMGHDLPRCLWPTIIGEIRQLADQSPASHNPAAPIARK